MKIYEKIVINIETGEILEEVSYDYDGPVAQCGGGGDCFIKGTQIETLKGPVNIEDVQILDRVLTYNTNAERIEARDVLGVMSQYHTGEGNDFMVTMKFGNGSINTNTATHPYLIKGCGWCSYLPEDTMAKYGMTGVGQVSVGDVAYFFDGEGISETLIQSIEIDRNPVVTYNLHSVDVNHNFFANRMLVHNKGGGNDGSGVGQGLGESGGAGESGSGGSGGNVGSSGNMGMGSDAASLAAAEAGVFGGSSGGNVTGAGTGGSTGSDADFAGISADISGESGGQQSADGGFGDAGDGETSSGMEGDQSIADAIGLSDALAAGEEAGGDMTSGFQGFDADFGFDTEANAVAAGQSAINSGAQNTETSFGFTEGGQPGSLGFNTSAGKAGFALGNAALGPLGGAVIGGLAGVIGGSSLGSGAATGMTGGAVGADGTVGDGDGGGGFGGFAGPDFGGPDDTGRGGTIGGGGSGSVINEPPVEEPPVIQPPIEDPVVDTPNEDLPPGVEPGAGREEIEERFGNRFGHFDVRQFEDGGLPSIFVPELFGLDEEDEIF